MNGFTTTPLNKATGCCPIPDSETGKISINDPTAGQSHYVMYTPARIVMDLVFHAAEGRRRIMTCTMPQGAVGIRSLISLDALLTHRGGSPSRFILGV